MCLLRGAGLWLQPSWQMSTIQDPRKTRLATGNLLTVWWKMPSLGLRLQQPLAFCPGCCMPASLPLGVREGPVCIQLDVLWYLLNPLFCEWARLPVKSFAGKFSLSLFFLSLAIPQFGLLSHISSLTLSSGHSDHVLTLVCSLGGRREHLCYFSTGSCS